MLTGLFDFQVPVRIESMRNLLVCTAVLTAAMFAAAPSLAQQSKPQPGSPDIAAKSRFGVWDNSTNPNNVMTYEPHEKGGMKITVTDPRKPEAAWSYVTFFDGKFMPVHNQDGSETAVEVIDAKSTRIYNKRNGVVNQVVINTLNEDNSQISNEYIRMDKDGKITGVTHVTYIKRKK
jgi:hypothetical protein